MKYSVRLPLIFLLAIIALPAIAQWTGETDIYNTNTGNVGIGTTSPTEKLHINGAVRGNAQGGALRINTAGGYIDIGPMNTLWSHFQTNLAKFYFNKPIHVDGAVSSYNTLDLDLQTNGIQRMRILNSNGYVGINALTPQGNLQVNSIRPIIIKNNGGNGVYGSELGFNAVLDTYVVPNIFRKLGNTAQYGGAVIAVDHKGSMFFQMYNGNTETESTVNYNPQIVFRNDGKVGIGSTSPGAQFTVALPGYTGTPAHSSLAFINQSTNPAGADLKPALEVSNNGGSGYGLVSLAASNYFSGNIGIGTTTPDAKLTVKGTIHTQEVKVDLNGAVAPDYVFEKDYDLRSLSEVESYTTQYKHLPEVPSSEEMEDNGVNLKEMNLLLLKKIEELTLYVIALNREIEKEKEERDAMQKEIDQLKLGK